MFQYHHAPLSEPIHILPQYHKFQQTLIIYKQEARYAPGYFPPSNVYL